MKTKANTVIEDGQDISVDTIKCKTFQVGELSKIYETPSGSVINFENTLDDLRLTLVNGDGLRINYDQIKLAGSEIVLDVAGDTVVFDDVGITFNIYPVFSIGASFNNDVSVNKRLTIGSYTTAERPTANEGTIIYDSTLKKCILYNGTSWVNLDGTALS